MRESIDLMRPLFERNVRWARYLKASCLLLIGLVVLPSALIPSATIGTRIFSLALFAAACFLAWRSLRSASVQVFRDHVVLHTERRTRTLTLGEIESFFTQATLAVVIPCRSLRVRLSNGSVVRTDFASYRRPDGVKTFTDTVCDELNGWLSSGRTNLQA